jgi:hypothetical protein
MMESVKKQPISRQIKPVASLIFLFCAAVTCALLPAGAVFLGGVDFFVFVAAIL